MPRRRLTARRLERWLRGRLDTPSLLGVSPDDRAELAWQAQARLGAGQMEEAERLYRLLAQLAPANEVLGALGVATCLQARGALEEAERGYDEVLAIEPENPFALANRAEVRLLTARPDPARADLAAASAVLDRKPGTAALLHDRVTKLTAAAEANRARAEAATTAGTDDRAAAPRGA